MSDFISLTCPTCGGRLQITNDVDRFACAYCGVEHIVRRGGGIVTLAPVMEGLRQVQAGVDRTASELAIRRLEAEINHLAEQYRLLAGQLAALPDHPNGWPLWKAIAAGVFFALLALCILPVVGMLSSGPRATLFCLIVPLTAVAASFAVTWINWRAIRREKARLATLQGQMQDTLAVLSRQIQDRQRQLTQHRRIVSG